MSLYVYHSNHLDILQQIVGHIIKSTPLDSPFDKEYILVQNFGMAKWLQTALANQLGILAQSEFLLPSKMLINLFEIIFNSDNKRDNNLQNLSKSRLFWPLVDIIYHLENVSELEPILHYIDAHNSENRLEKSMDLAEQIATIFDKYIVHRAEWTQAWDRNELIEELPKTHQIWQSILWRKVCEYLEKPTHFGNIKPLLEKKLSELSVQLKLPKRIFIIGLTSLPPLFLDLLILFSKSIDIHLLFNNPAQYYWGDISKYGSLQQQIRTNYYTNEKNNSTQSPYVSEDQLLNENWQDSSGNPLLASLGKVGRDHLYLLQLYEHQEIEAFSEPEPTTLLKKLHSTIFHLLPIEETQPFVVEPSDRSITIHKSYSPLREIEALHDQLLHLFNQNENLVPSDIVVMTPDIEEYAPFINAIFGNITDTRFIPYSISDVSLSVSEPLLESFIALLSLPDMSFTANEIIHFLKLPEISQKFEIEENDLELISYWINNASIRLGIDQNHIKNMGFREEEKNTWLWGLKRMLLGYATKKEEMVDDLLPFTAIQGMDALLIGKLINFIEILIKWQKILRQSKLLSAWQTLLSDLWNDLFIANEETDLKFHFLLTTWQNIINHGLEIEFSAYIPIKPLAIRLKNALNDEKPIQNFIQGKVTFCSFVPMRAIPFKVIALLGLNQEDFPKTGNYHDFDLMQYYPMRGDRTRHSDDRYLFLEAILSAQDRLYLSYIGSSIQDNSEQLPSLLIDELLNYLKQITDISRLDKSLIEHLVIQHPMASFNPQLFKNNDEKQSFRSEWIQSSTVNYATPYQLPSVEVNTICVNDLVRFYQDPSQFFSQKRLELRTYTPQEIEIEDHESFVTPTGLTRYRYRHEIVEKLLQSGYRGDALDNYASTKLQTYYAQKGILPKFAFQALAWEKLIIPCLALTHTLHKNNYLQEYEEISLLIDNISIIGELPTIQNNQVILWEVGALNLKRKIKAFLIHLLHHLQGKFITTLLYAIDKNEVNIFEYLPLEAGTIDSLQKNYLDGFIQGLTYPLLSFENVPSPSIIESLIHFLEEENLTDFATIYNTPLEDLSNRITTSDNVQKSLKKLELFFEEHEINRRIFPKITLREHLIYCLFYKQYILPIL